MAGNSKSGNRAAKGVKGHCGKNAGRKPKGGVVIERLRLSDDLAEFVEQTTQTTDLRDGVIAVLRTAKERNMEKAMEVAKAFAGELAEYVGEQEGTRYVHGASDREMYFESVSGKHIVVAVSGQDGSMSVAKSDGIVW